MFLINVCKIKIIQKKNSFLKSLRRKGWRDGEKQRKEEQGRMEGEWEGENKTEMGEIKQEF